MSSSAWNQDDIISKKTVSISQKRQITIPKKFFDRLGFGSEAECFLRGNELVIRPISASNGGEFAEQILADLIAQGLSGEALLEAFHDRQQKVRPAVESMLAEAKQAAIGRAASVSLAEVFGEEE